MADERTFVLVSSTVIHTQPFNGPLSGTTRVSRYQKGKTNLHLTEARDSEWQWHQLGHMQVCISIQSRTQPYTALCPGLTASAIIRRNIHPLTTWNIFIVLLAWQSLSIIVNLYSTLPSVLWHCWLGNRKGIRPVKNWAVGCWHGYLSGARWGLAYGPADATATHCLLLQ